jgi:uncharacterized membrane protein
MLAAIAAFVVVYVLLRSWWVLAVVALVGWLAG